MCRSHGSSCSQCDSIFLQLFAPPVWNESKLAPGVQHEVLAPVSLFLVLSELCIDPSQDQLILPYPSLSATMFSMLSWVESKQLIWATWPNQSWVPWRSLASSPMETVGSICMITSQSSITSTSTGCEPAYFQTISATALPVKLPVMMGHPFDCNTHRRRWNWSVLSSKESLFFSLPSSTPLTSSPLEAIVSRALTRYKQ